MQAYPWDKCPSIYEYIKAHIRPDQKGLSEGGITLPDRERLESGSRLRWAPGAHDGVISQHTGGEEDDGDAESLISLVHDYCLTPTLANKARVYEFLVKKGASGLIDPVITRISKNTGINRDRLYDLAISFARESPEREPVKFGVTVLGLYPDMDNRELFQTLGRHDEFTLYCAVALSNSVEDPQTELWKLAQQVNGWGRIQTVQRLAGTDNPEIKDWLLREGYKNSVAYGYLAYTCATTGGLLTALRREDVDGELFTSAGQIIEALIEGGPAEDMDSYRDGADAVDLFVRQAERKAASLDDLLAVIAIMGFLDEDDADSEIRSQEGWTPQMIAPLADQCSAIIKRPQWREVVINGLRSKDETVFFKADRAAKVLGIDTWDAHWDRLRASPRNELRWLRVMQECNRDRVAAVIALASEQIPIEEIATGPALEIGLGPEHEVHRCLAGVLQGLRRFPGQGDRFIRSGLKSPVIRVRYAALAALAEWGKSRWPNGMDAALAASIPVEPHDGVRRAMERVAAGEPYDARPEEETT